MDYSAYDAHALLVEADGRRVFYSGDFRGHGRKAGVIERFVADPPGEIDVLLMEGTTIGRDGESLSEAQVEDQALDLMRSHEGMVLTCFAGQNIDRFMTFLRASQRAGRTFVIDVYLANLLIGLQEAGLPDVRRDPGLRILLPKSQKRMIVRDKRFDLVDPLRRQRIFHEELAADPGRFAMVFRTSMIGDLEGVNLTGGALLYSLWPGYLERDRTDLRRWANDSGLAFHLVHSSGHAHRADLQRMAAALQPRRLIPIHSDKPETYETLFERVHRTPNGAWVEV